ncbi:MAG TPA: 3'-5' exonuclease [Gemmatimonadales bacterium]|nr:3'-5' exonuclease [Gemmatimonadales bacterium]
MLTTIPQRTLADRAMDLMLATGPCDAERLASEIMGLRAASRAVSERLAVALLAADPRVRQLEDGRWALVAEAHGSPLIETCSFAVVDCETTGSRAQTSDRITEVAIVVVHGARREMVFESLVNPGFSIPWRVAQLTGINDAMVRRAPLFDDIADQVVTALAGRVFVAHNARFDWAFLSAEIRRAKSHRLAGSHLCTVRLAKRLLPGLESGSLDALSWHFGLENPARHRAGGDAMATAQLLERLILIAREQGARTLADLHAMCRPRPKVKRPRKRRF